MGKARGLEAGLKDAEAFAAANPAGYLGLYLDGELAATISLVEHNKSFGFIGFRICAPEHRGKSFGFKLWNHAPACCKAAAVGLDGVKAQQQN